MPYPCTVESLVLVEIGMPRSDFVCLQVQMPPEMRDALETLAGPRGTSKFVRDLVQGEINQRLLPVRKKKQKRA